MSNLEKYNQIFMQVFSLNEIDLEQDFTFANNQIWDSLAHIQLITKLEENFDILMDSNDILNYKSYANGMKILGKYGIEIS